MNGIAVVLPTRNRPHQLERFVNSLYENAKNKENIFVYLYVDDDDTLTGYALKNLSSLYGNKIFSLVGPRILMSETANKLVPFVKQDIFFMGGDDLIIRTKDWDEKIIEKFNSIEDKIALVYGDDLHPDPNYKNFATHPIVHRRWVEHLGYLTPPYFSSEYADTWLNYVADKLNRKFKLDFVNEHLHWVFGKAPRDLTYIETGMRHARDNPPAIYNSLQNKRDEDFVKLQKLLGTKHEK